MAYYHVAVYNEKFKVEASSPADASRKGRDEWRNQHRTMGENEAFREPEPRTVVTILVGTGIPVV